MSAEDTSAAAPYASDSASLNSNLGPGQQQNYTQSGGSYNSQYNAASITFNQLLSTASGFPSASTLAQVGNNVIENRASLRPFSTVPYRRDPNFIDRPELMEQIRTRAITPGARVALVGPGGVGKSQLAIEYAARARTQSPDTWVFWIYASNATRFDESVLRIVERLQVPGRSDPAVDPLRLLQAWSQNECHGTWLLLLDNVDAPEFLFEPYVSDSPTIRTRFEGLPTSDNGTIIITTRNRGAALNLKLYEEDLVSVSGMSEDEAALMLYRKLGKPDEDHAKLARSLDYIPLAMTQAAAYIENMQRVGRGSVQQYLINLEKSDESRAQLLQKGGPEFSIPNRDRDAINSVLLTWHISLQYIESVRSSATRTLALMSCCDRTSIPEAVLIDGSDEDLDLEKAKTDLDADLLLLQDFSIISSSTEPNTWDMHRLVQDATQLWLERCGRLEDTRATLVRRLCPEVLTNNSTWIRGLSTRLWPRGRRLHSHAMTPAFHNPGEFAAALAWADLMMDMARSASERGDSAGFQSFALSSLQARSKHLGKDHILTILNSCCIASTHDARVQYETAELLFRQTSIGSTVNRGAAGRFASNSVIAIAKVLMQSRPSVITRLQTQILTTTRAIEIIKHISGPTPTKQSGAIDSLSYIHTKQDQHHKAEPLQAGLLESKHAAFAPTAPNLLLTMQSLARGFRDQGRWVEAAKLLETATRRSATSLGAGHPIKSSCAYDLACAYEALSRWHEAELLYRIILKERQATLEKDQQNGMGVDSQPVTSNLE